MKNIILFGGGGHCFATIELIKSLDEYFPKLVYDDLPKKTQILGVLVKKYKNETFSNEYLCISIGNNTIRKEKASLFKGATFPKFIHKSCVVYPSVSIGEGSVILPNAVLDAESVVGEFCIVNNNASISHNVLLRNYVHVAINVAIAGGVSIGEGTLVGAGSVILPEITVGKWVIIGAGSIVTKDIPDGAVVFGNPARIIKYQSF